VVANALAPLLRERAAGNAATLDPADLPDLRQRLLAAYAPLAGGAAVLTDKMPLNFRYLGFVCAALPEARIVHLVRDPMAVAWSIYKHLFAGNANRFAYSIGDICAFMLLHRDMMSFWRNRLGDHLHDLDYAALTHDPDTEIRALVDACHLPWSDACLTPQQSDRTVLTASAAQVRRPIYRDGDKGWRRYEAELAPLRHALKVTGLLE
jgi:hypothetical protein